MNTDFLTTFWPVLSAMALFGVLLWTQTHWTSLKTWLRVQELVPPKENKGIAA